MEETRQQERKSKVQFLSGFVLILLCFTYGSVVMLNGTTWNYRGTWSNFDYEYHFQTILKIYDTGRYPLEYDQEYHVGFYPPLSHLIVMWYLIEIKHPSLLSDLARPWAEMFILNSIVNALQMIPLFLASRRLTGSNAAGVLACLLIVANGFATWPVMGPFPNIYGLVFLSFANYLLYEACRGGSWAAPAFVLAGILLICGGYCHPLSYIFSAAVPLGVFVGGFMQRTFVKRQVSVKLQDLAFLTLSLSSLIIPGVTYHMKADYSGFVPHVIGGLPPGVRYYPPLELVSDPWFVASLVVLGYTLWRREPGAVALGVWLIMPLVLPNFYGIAPPYSWVLLRYVNYLQPYPTQPEAILIASGLLFLVREATAKTGTSLWRRRVRLLIAGVTAIILLVETVLIITSPQAGVLWTSIQRLRDGALSWSLFGDLSSTVLFILFGLGVCAALKFRILTRFADIWKQTTVNRKRKQPAPPSEQSATPPERQGEELLLLCEPPWIHSS